MCGLVVDVAAEGKLLLMVVKVVTSPPRWSEAHPLVWGSKFGLDPKRDPPLQTNWFEGNEK